MIDITTEDYGELNRLEESLWRAETRYHLAYMEQTLAPDFFEFGRSGRVYKREDTLDVSAKPIAAKPIAAKLPLPNFHARLITADVALVTYISVVTYGDVTEVANRSSLWSRYPAGWRLRFHQGTPTTAPS